MGGRGLRFVLCLSPLVCGLGCESALETGYKPRPLNATETDRRAYYAPAFTPESQRQDSAGPAPGAGFRRPGS